LPPNFQCPLAAKLCIRLPNVLEVKNDLEVLYYHAKFGFHPPPGWPKTLSFLCVCLFVCLSVTLLNVRHCAPDFAMKALEYRNDFDAVG